MRYNKIRKMDISNGYGIRVSLFTQGCHFHCKGCFNEETWDFNKGKDFSTKTQDDIISLCNLPYIKGLSILGGEPLELCNLVDLKEFLIKFRSHFKNTKDIWLWTGYYYDKLNSEQKEITQLCDYIIAGPYIDNLKSPDKDFGGSTNQQIIKIHKEDGIN